DETSPILKTFITGLENQLSLKVKVIRSNNGTEFKNHDLDQFCRMKGIKREFSVPRTPQQNGIAERKIKTLIEAARTMLADLLLPIPFWVEAVNTACYVQNRVLVSKPHNKTPYELLHGRTPSIGFMRPFGCPVTILNTLDSLGKFNRKVDEGILVGYSVSSKAFRVLNSRTSIVQETLHVNFLENKPNVAGSGPTWLFNIDILTKTMNYQLVTAGNQSNPSAGIQDKFDAEKTGEESDQYNNMQTQTSNTLHNAIMEAGSKDCPPMLAPGWKDKPVLDSEGSPTTTTERVFETYKNVTHDIRDQLNAEAEAEAVQIILTGIDNDIYSIVDACSNACEMWKAIKRLKQESRAEDCLISQTDKEIDKLMALISLSFKKIYKPINNNLRTSSNTSRAHQDNSPRFNKNAGYENQRNGTVAGARETVGSTVVSPDAADSGPIFDDEPLKKVSTDNHYNVFAMEKLARRNSKEYASKMELECAKVRDKLSAHQETISILSKQKETQIKLYKTREDKELEKFIELENKVMVLDNIVYNTGQSVQTMNMLNNKFQTSFAKPEFLKKLKRANPRLYDIGCYNDNLALMLAPESDEVIRLEKESRSKLSDLIKPFDYTKLNNLYDLFVPQLKKSSEQRYFSERSRMSHIHVQNEKKKRVF
nr:retrovirus-related Pol polyprotein from transposon TNT 1-94 [Tanacetum cinerariifolium]